MFYIFLLSLPFLALSIITINNKDILVSYATTALLIFYFFARKDNAKIYFPKEAKAFFVFFIYVLITVGYRLIYNIIDPKSISAMATIAIYFFFYLLLINVFDLRSKGRLLKHINVFIFICVLFALYSGLQGFLPADSIINRLFRNANNAYTIYNPALYPAKHIMSINYNRVSGLAAEPGLWAVFLTMPLCLLLPRLYYKFRMRDFGAFLGIFFPFLLTGGRSGFLSLFLAIISFPCFVLSGNNRKLYALFTVTVISLSIFMGIFSEFTPGSDRDWSQIERANGMIVATRMFIANPIFGIGIGRYRQEQGKYQFKGINIAAGQGDYPYSFYLSLAAETGIIGLILWLLFLKTIGDKLYFMINNIKGGTDEKILYAGLILSFLSIAFGWINIGGINSVYYFFIFAIISVLSNIKRIDRSKTNNDLETSN